MPKRQSTKYPGVYSYEKSDGEVIYYIRYKREEKLIEEKAGRAAAGMTPARASLLRAAKIDGKALSNEEAREERRRQREEMKGGPRWTLEKLFDEYQDNLPQGGGRAADATNFKRLGDLRTKEPSEIEIAELRDLRRGLEREGLAPQTVKHILRLFIRIVNWAAAPEQQLITLEIPARLKMKMPVVDNAPKTEALNDEQLIKYLAALDEEKDQDAAALLRLALFTGMRKGALLALKWTDLDFERDIIVLRGESAKNEETSPIPMNETVKGILARIPRTSEYVFPNPKGGKRQDFRRMSRRVRDAAGLPPDYRPLHGLRHSFASRIASSGEVDMYRLQMLMTHKSPAMTQRYAHLSDEAMKKAAAVAARVMDMPEAPKKEIESQGNTGREKKSQKKTKKD